MEEEFDDQTDAERLADERIQKLVQRAYGYAPEQLEAEYDRVEEENPKE